MEVFKMSVDIEENRKIFQPCGEIMVIIQPIINGKQSKRGEVDLASRGIDPKLAAEMRNRLISFEDDWNAPGMEVYDAL